MSYNPRSLLDSCLQTVRNDFEDVFLSWEKVKHLMPFRLREKLLEALVGVNAVTDEFLPPDFLTEEFRVLKFYDCKITIKFFTSMANLCPFLEELNTTKCLRFTDDSLEIVLRACKNLRKLRCCACRLLTDRGIKHMITLGTELQAVDLGGCINVPIQSSRDLFKTHPGRLYFRELGLAGMDLNDNDIQDLVRCCPRLEFLSCGYSAELGLNGAQAIAQELHHMKHLRLHWCDRINNFGLIALASGCPSLEVLDIQGVLAVDDANIISFIHSRLTPPEKGSMEELSGLSVSKLKELNLKFIPTPLVKEVIQFVNTHVSGLRIISNVR